MRRVISIVPVVLIAISLVALFGTQYAGAETNATVTFAVIGDYGSGAPGTYFADEIVSMVDGWNLGYFTAATKWPAYKNFSNLDESADNVCFDIVSNRFAFLVSTDWHTSDSWPNTDIQNKVAQIANWVNSPTTDMPAPEFMVITGDFPDLSQTEGIIHTQIAGDFLWYPVIGNHEISDNINNFYDIRDTKVPSLPYIVDYGPAGSVNSTYSWSFQNAHFVAINGYWNGNTSTGSDTAADGDIVPALNTWIGNDLANNGETHNFAFIHEPAYPAHRHVGDSLDAHSANRDAFIATLNAYDVQSLFTGHTHYYEHDVAPEFPLGNLHQVTNGNLRDGSDTTVTYILVEGSTTTYKVYSWTGSVFELHEQWTIASTPPTCYNLTISHTGQGSDPIASPTNSTGCPSGQYIAGEAINLSGAIPDTGWQISGWTGTSQDNSTALSNFLTVPASEHAVSVIYKVHLYLPIIYGSA